MPKTNPPTKKEADPEETETETQSIRDVVEEEYEQSKSKAEDTDTVPETKAKTEAEIETEAEKPSPQDDKVVEETVKAAKEAVVKKVRESFGLDEVTAVKPEDDLTPPWVKEDRAPKDYVEIGEWSAKLAESKRKTEEKEVKARADEVKASQEAQNQKLNDQWDMELNELRESGRLPKINPAVAAKIKANKPLSDEEMKDPGIKAQQEIFQTMYVVSQERSQHQKPAVTNLKEVYYEYYAPQKAKQKPGADAPISGGEAAISATPEAYSYKDVHKSSFYDILLEK